MKKLFFTYLLFISCFTNAQVKIEKWKVFELTLHGSTKGNPFTDVQLTGVFQNGIDTFNVKGFYDGEGVYKIRFMPQKEGLWYYSVYSNDNKLNKEKGNFICTKAQSGNHGMVGIKDTLYFSYSDDTPYYPFGTTCYAWVHQGDSLADVTLKTLSDGTFNKIRMCIFPKSFDWNHNEPILYPFEGEPLTKWDFHRFNPAYFKNIEKRIQQLDSLGIEADLIVFHPYDRWGFSTMNKEVDRLYIDYIISRFAAYKNVWWSLANEFDLLTAKTMNDWDNYIQEFADQDPYNHLRSIHNCAVFYDHTNPLISHASIQLEDTYNAKEFTKKYNKPVIFDECRYEGNISWSWGNITPQTMVEKFWRGVLNGGFVGHGETYIEDTANDPEKSNEKIWWSHGGILHGKSPERIKFLRNIIESAPEELRPIELFPSWMPFETLGIEDEYYLIYFNDAQPGYAVLDLSEDVNFKVEIIDTWNMTIEEIDKIFSGKSVINLPEKPYIALRIVKISRSLNVE